MTTIEVDEDLVAFCFRHFHALDVGNAAVHCAEVKFSPITFRLAEYLHTSDYWFDDCEVAEALVHKGRYEEDPGR